MKRFPAAGRIIGGKTEGGRIANFEKVRFLLHARKLREDEKKQEQNYKLEKTCEILFAFKGNIKSPVIRYRDSIFDRFGKLWNEMHQEKRDLGMPERAESPRALSKHLNEKGRELSHAVKNMKEKKQCAPRTSVIIIAPWQSQKCTDSWDHASRFSLVSRDFFIPTQSRKVSWK